MEAKQITRNQRENKEESEVKWNRERRSFTQWTEPEATSEGVSQVVGGDTGEEQEEESLVRGLVEEEDEKEGEKKKGRAVQGGSRW